MCGLYDLAAWVAAHPDLPVPQVRAWVSSGGEVDDAAGCVLVDRAAAAAGVVAGWSHGHYQATAWFGPVELACYRIPEGAWAEARARDSYRDNVRVDGAGPAGVAGGGR